MSVPAYQMEHISPNIVYFKEMGIMREKLEDLEDD